MHSERSSEERGKKDITMESSNQQQQGKLEGLWKRASSSERGIISFLLGAGLLAVGTGVEQPSQKQGLLEEWNKAALDPLLAGKGRPASQKKRAVAYELQREGEHLS